MANIILKESLSIEDKVILMQEDARFDVADAEVPGPRGKQFETGMPDLSLFQDIRSRKAPPAVPKVFLAGTCVFNCAYCSCRASHERERYCLAPRELAELAVQQAREKTQGVFISSAIYKNANYTEELIIETLRIIRKELYYEGYVHAKIMPGTDPLLIEQVGRYADRLSVNIEVASSQGYHRVAKQKNKENILTPMKQIRDLIQSYQQSGTLWRPKFATSQTTQLMAGSTEETDRRIMVLSHALYQKYKMKRVYYTAFQYQNPAKGYEELPLTSTPVWRVRRLYQADRLMELYGYTPDEITPEEAPDLQEELDPKIGWALRNLHLFPMEVNKAEYEQLLRIPGIGIVYAKKIIRARKYCILTHEILKEMGVSLKRSKYFITCNGKYAGDGGIDNPRQLYRILSEKSPEKETERLS